MRASWPQTRLADLCSRVTVGHVGSMRNEYIDGGVPFLRSQNVQPFRIDTSQIKYVGEDFHHRLKKSALSSGDVVIVRTGDPGTAARIPESLPIANCADLVVITPGPELDSRYLVAIFNSSWGKSAVQGRLVGAAQQHFNVTTAKELMVPNPPLAVQRKIAAVLAAYDELIENNLRRIEILEEMAQAVFREWFVDFRFPGHEDVALVDSPLRPIPEGWEAESFSELADFVNGFAFKPAHLGDAGLPIVKIKELKKGVTPDTPRNPGSEIAEKFHIEQGDLLFSWSADLVVQLWPHGPALLNQHLFRVLPKEPDIGVDFLVHALAQRLPDFRARAQGTTMRHIKRSALTEVQTAIPPTALRGLFADSVRPIHELVRNLVLQNANLRSTRDLLLPKLVSGDIDVSDLEIDTEWLAS